MRPEAQREKKVFLHFLPLLQNVWYVQPSRKVAFITPNQQEAADKHLRPGIIQMKRVEINMSLGINLQ